MQMKHLACVALFACASSQSAAVRLVPPDPPPAVTDPASMLAFARIAAVVDIHVAPEFVDHVVRWQRGMRDLVRGAEDALGHLVERAGIVLPDVAVLTVEPVAHTESSGFGWRDDPIRHSRSFHSGSDFRADPGTPVVAAGDGVVVFCGRYYGYGNMIEIDHGGGVVTRYAHLRKIEVTQDTVVTAGSRIGQVGQTGRATGPHLHFEVRLDGAPVSPVTAMSVAALERETPIAGHLAAMALAPEIQSRAESAEDPPRQSKVKQDERPERAGRAKRQQVLW